MTPETKLQKLETGVGTHLPVRIFSDLHLGHKASRIDKVESLRPLFQGAGTVVFNGDTWEELAGVWRENSLAMLEDLKRILAEEGCEAIFLRGNHDPGFEGNAWLELADGRIAVTHGDAVLRDSSPWKHEIISGADTVEEIWRRFPDAEVNLESRLAVAKEIAVELSSGHHPEQRNLFSRIRDAAFPPKRAMEILKAWASQWNCGARFCRRYFPKAEILVIGHFHFSGVRKTGGKTVVNLGSFVVPGKAKWAEWDGKKFSVGDVLEAEEEFRMS